MIKCPNCTGELDFDVKDQEIKCSYCGSVFKPSELKARLKTSGEKKKNKEEKEEKKEEDEGKYIDAYEYTCSQCGAELLTFDDTAVTFCSYCGSQAMIESKMIKQNAPDVIIPFKKEKEECINNYKKKISKALFAPNYMKQETVIEKFRGIFIPYVIYEVGHNGNVSNKGSKYSHRSGNYEYYDDYSISADVDASYDGISYDLISKYYDKFSEAIPFNYKEKIEFNPNYLIGFYADKKDVSSDVYDKEVIKIAENDASHQMAKNKTFAKYGCSSPKVSLSIKNTKTGMFPVYFVAIKDKSGKRVNYAVVNGQTGEVAVEIPISFAKYVTSSLITSILVFLLINSTLVLQPKTICFFSIVFGITSLIATSIQFKKIEESRTHSKDKGYLFVNPIKKIKDKKKQQEIKKEKPKVLPYIYKEILACIIPLLVFFSGTIKDELYYGAAIIGIILVTLSFRDLIKEHNLIVSNKLPQLEKRGGDENA